MIRVVLVDDSVTQREILRRVLSESGEFHVIGEAKNGREAVESIEEHRPDVVLMDIHMPELDGIEATREIMNRCPTPIVIMSATLKKRDIDMAVDAFHAGAFAVLAKPEGAVLLNLESMADEVLAELRNAARARLRKRSVVEPRPLSDHEDASAQPSVEAVGICVSTGGPATLLEIFAELPRPYPVPILLVQHISEGFAVGFSRWLEEKSGQPCHLAETDQAIGPGVWLAPPGHHLALASRVRFELIPRRSSDIHCPAGDVLLSSLAAHKGGRAVGFVLTGMGDDGADGLLALKEAGGATFVQDEGSSLIWGMPKAALDLGAARRQMSPRRIGLYLAGLAKRGTSQ